MEKREDIAFTYNEKEEKRRTIYANSSPNFFFLHPKRMTEEMKKIETNCPDFYGEIEKGKILIMQKGGTMHALNADLSPKELKVNTHYNGKIIIEGESYQEKGLIIKNNLEQTLFESVKTSRWKETHYTIYTTDKIQIVITDRGKFYLTSSEAEISDTDYGFLEERKIDETTKFYIAYNLDCEIIMADTDYQELQNKLKTLNVRTTNSFINPLEKRKQELYQNYLCVLLAEKWKLQFNYEENYLQTLPEKIVNKKAHQVIDLDNNEIIDGTFQECIELRNNNFSTWIEKIEDLDITLAEYKRTRELTLQNNKEGNI